MWCGIAWTYGQCRAEEIVVGVLVVLYGERDRQKSGTKRRQKLGVSTGDISRLKLLSSIWGYPGCLAGCLLTRMYTKHPVIRT